MDPSTRMLFVLAATFLHLCFVLLMLQFGAEPRWALGYFIDVSFFVALYFRRRLWLRRQRGGAYHGLGYAAVMLGALASALFFLSVGAAMPVPLAVGVWLGLAVAAYYFYRVMLLHLGEEPAAVQAQSRQHQEIGFGLI